MGGGQTNLRHAPSFRISRPTLTTKHPRSRKLVTVIANKINEAFLEPVQPFRNLECTQVTNEVPLELVSEPCVLNALTHLSANKATGSEGIPNWLLKDYADILSHPITSILNSSFAEQRLPALWKNVDVISIPKEKPVTDIKNQLRPMSLTPAVSKIAEDFITNSYISRPSYK